MIKIKLIVLEELLKVHGYYTQQWLLIPDPRIHCPHMNFGSDNGTDVNHVITGDTWKCTILQSQKQLWTRSKMATIKFSSLY